MKPYAVDITWTAVVMAATSEDATEAARLNLSDITRWDSPDYSQGKPIKSMGELCAIGWDGQCLPYGGDGSTRLSDILAEPAPERDTKTIDMFGEG